MRDTDLNLFLIGTTFKGEINCNNIFYSIQHTQILPFQHVVTIKSLGEKFTFFSLYEVFQIQCVFYAHSTAQCRVATLKKLFKDFIYTYFRERGREGKRERSIHVQVGDLCKWGTCAGVEPATFQTTRRSSVHWATPAGVGDPPFRCCVDAWNSVPHVAQGVFWALKTIVKILASVKALSSDDGAFICFTRTTLEPVGRKEQMGRRVEAE